jgi:putative ABC transport system substrate-binding protein
MNISYQHAFTGLALILLICCLVSCQEIEILCPDSPTKTVLIINSDRSVSEYNTIHQRLRTELENEKIDIKEFDLTRIGTVRSEVSNVCPQIVYAIGTRAYMEASTIVKDKKVLIFSGVLNWERFELGSSTYGIAFEVSTEKQLVMYKNLFPDIRHLGVLYSKSKNRELFEKAKLLANSLNLTLHEKTIENTTEITHKLRQLLTEVDAIWLIPDPILGDMRDVRKIFQEAAKKQKPIFAHDTKFCKYDPVLIISTDISAIGKQAASLAQNLFNHEFIPQQVQDPIDQVTINRNKVKEYNIKVDKTQEKGMTDMLCSQ